MTSSVRHSQRCETCNRPIGKPDGSDDCPISIPSHLDVAIVYCFEKVGCASWQGERTMPGCGPLHFASHGRKVITLCGSVKFWDEYREWNAKLTLEGNIILSCGISMKEGFEDLLCDLPLPLDDVKADLDAIHLCKIDMSDEIFVLNVGGYIGDSTRREIEYALSHGKRVKYLEPKAAALAANKHEEDEGK